MANTTGSPTHEGASTSDRRQADIHTEFTITDAQREQMWNAIVRVRDAHPRAKNDADTEDIIDALLPVITNIVATANAGPPPEGDTAASKPLPPPTALPAAVTALIRRAIQDRREKFIPGRYPATYAADFVRAHRDIVPAEITTSLVVIDSRSDASEAITLWAQRLDVDEADLARELADSYVQERNLVPPPVLAEPTPDEAPTRAT